MNLKTTVRSMLSQVKNHTQLLIKLMYVVLGLYEAAICTAVCTLQGSMLLLCLFTAPDMHM